MPAGLFVVQKTQADMELYMLKHKPPSKRDLSYISQQFDAIMRHAALAILNYNLVSAPPPDHLSTVYAQLHALLKNYGYRYVPYHLDPYNSRLPRKHTDAAWYLLFTRPKTKTYSLPLPESTLIAWGRALSFSSEHWLIQNLKRYQICLRLAASASITTTAADRHFFMQLAFACYDRIMYLTTKNLLLNLTAYDPSLTGMCYMLQRHAMPSSSYTLPKSIIDSMRNPFNARWNALLLQSPPHKD